MLDILSSTKTIEDQTAVEKVTLLKTIAHQMLGRKWVYYRKIKHAAEGFKLLREKSLMEQMKATQAALRFTSRHTKKTYRNTYRSCVNEIKKFTGLKAQNFPEIVDVAMGEEPPSLDAEHDETIISWTPIKFLTPVRTIREKGVATQPHSEGLAAKLFFKVVGYYALPENWDKEKLTIYLRRLDHDSTFSEVNAALANLKEDLLKLSECFVPFKFGKAAISKDKSSDEHAFDEDLGESIEDQIRTLYWYHFIYLGMEYFLLRYYLMMISATSSEIAIRLLSQFFKPAIFRAVENRIIFETSLETDKSKRKLRRKYEEYRRNKENEPAKKKIKTKQGIFETYNYTLPLIENLNFGIEINSQLAEDSEWGQYLDYELLDAQEYVIEKGSLSTEPVPHVVIEYSIIQILNLLVNATQYQRKARHKTLELYKERVESDKEFAEKRIYELKKQGDKHMRGLERKVTKLRRMKQMESAEVYKKDIEIFRRRLDEKCNNIIKSSQQEIKLQKRRIQVMFQEISQEHDVSEGVSAKHLLDLIAAVSPRHDFLKEFIKNVGERIQKEYEKDLEAFYQNMFYILTPSIQEKVILIQSLEKSGRDDAVKLSLTDEEREENQKTIDLLKLKIRKIMPNIFNCKVVYQTSLIPVPDLFKLSVDNNSLQTLLKLKVTSKQNSKPINLKENIIKVLMVLNLVTNPVAKNNIILEEREHLKDPQQMINGPLLAQLLKEIALSAEAEEAS